MISDHTAKTELAVLPSLPHGRRFVYWGRIHRMILWELLKVFILALIGLTGMILMGGIVGEASRNGLSPLQILGAIPLLLPSLLPYTIPTTTLFATCIVYGRLSADNEIIALKSAGIHIIHMLWPALLLGLVASVITMILYVDVIPSTRFSMRTRAVGDIEELLYAMLSRERCIKHPKIEVEIHVDSIQGRKLQDVLFMRKATNGGGFDLVARAKEAELRVETATKRLLIYMHQCEIVQGQGVGTQGVALNHIWPVDLPAELCNPSPTKGKPSDMTWLELNEHEEKLLHKQQKISHEIDVHQLADNLSTGQPGFARHVLHKINERKECDRQLAFISSERHMRPAIAIGCLCFALVGCPVGIWFSKSDFLSAFITCFLPIVVLYYPLLLCMINWSRAGRLIPWIGVYNADLLMLLVGSILFHRLARH